MTLDGYNSLYSSLLMYLGKRHLYDASQIYQRRYTHNAGEEKYSEEIDGSLVLEELHDSLI